MKLIRSLTIIFLMLLALQATALDPKDSLYVSVDTSRTTYCDRPEARQFDFWIGEWDLTWSTGNDIGRGKSIITSELGSCMIEENFASKAAEPFIGHSISVFDRKSGQWKQTWTDNRGGYLEFSGGWKDDQMILSRETINDSIKITQRMVWYDITKSSLEWKWEQSSDNGTTWQILWSIHHERKK